MFAFEVGGEKQTLSRNPPGDKVRGRTPRKGRCVKVKIFSSLDNWLRAD